MTALFLQRVGFVAVAGLILTACDGEKAEMMERRYAVGFAQPFPALVRDKTSFPVRWQGMYRAADSRYALCIGPTAVWTRKQRRAMYHATWQQLDSLRLFLGVKGADSTYQDFNGNLHQLRVVGHDSVRDSWQRLDTVFSLAGPTAGRLRRFRGGYYLSTRSENPDCWQVQRLEVSGNHLVWQSLGQDTLRLRALDTASVRVERARGFSLFRVRPATRRQTRHVGDYAGLWETEGEFERQH
jgi:hypothetical protein